MPTTTPPDTETITLAPMTTPTKVKLPFGHHFHNKEQNWLQKLEEQATASGDQPLQRWCALKREDITRVILVKDGQFYEVWHNDADVCHVHFHIPFMCGEKAWCGFPNVSYAGKSVFLQHSAGCKTIVMEYTEEPSRVFPRVSPQTREGRRAIRLWAVFDRGSCACCNMRVTSDNAAVFGFRHRDYTTKLCGIQKFWGPSKRPLPSITNNETWIQCFHAELEKTDMFCSNCDVLRSQHERMATRV